MRSYFWFCISATLALIAIVSQDASAQSRDQNLEHFLDRLGLERLKNSHFEHKLAQLDENIPDQAEIRLRIANTLAENYITEIASSIDDETRQADLRQRLADLLLKCPQISHPRIDASLLTADFSRLQAAVFRWYASTPLSEPSTTEESRHLEKQFNSILKEWQLTRSTVAERLKELSKQSDAGFGTGIVQQEIDEYFSIDSQLQFIGGWIGYYHVAVLEFQSKLKPEARQEKIEAAEALFLSLLQYKSVAELSSGELDSEELSILWVSRSVLGLAMLATARGDLEIREKLFTILKKPEVASQVRNDIHWWELQSAAFVKKWELAANCAENRIIESAKENLSNSQFWIACIAHATHDTGDSFTSNRLLSLGLQGLMREERFALAKKLIEEKELQLPKNSFVDLWFRGYLAYESAEDLGDARVLELAERLIEQAVAMNQSNITRLDLAKCRYLLAWIKFQLGKNEEAEKLFRISSLGLRSVDEETASKALWIRIVALKNLASEEKDYLRRIPAAINELIRLYPNSPYAEKAAFEQARFQFDESDPQKAIKKLGQIPDSHPFFLQAQLEILRLNLNIILGLPTGSAEHASKLKEFDILTKQFLSICTDPERNAQAISMLVDALFTEAPPDASKIREWLEKANAFAAELDHTTGVKANLVFQTYRLAVKTNDVESRTNASDWLVSPANTNRQYRVVVLIDKAKDLEIQTQKTTNAEDRKVLIGKSYQTNLALMNLFGTDQKQLLKNRNARVIFFTVADLEAELGYNDKAIERFELLCELFPRQQNYVYKLAKLYSATSDGNKALPLWRTLAKGTEVGSELWLEAKFETISRETELAIDASEKQKLRQILEQCLVLAPNMTDDWKSKFDQLRKSFENK